jgi:DNA polymerase-3 subunit epsilon
MAALARLRIPAWPYRGPIGILERNEFLDREDIHLIDAWRYLGTVRNDADLHDLLQSPERVPFDLDTWKLLKAQLKKRGSVIRKLEN